jgi:uncharacterized protein with PIN domain
MDRHCEQCGAAMLESTKPVVRASDAAATRKVVPVYFCPKCGNVYERYDPTST